MCVGSLEDCLRTYEKMIPGDSRNFFLTVTNFFDAFQATRAPVESVSEQVRNFSKFCCDRMVQLPSKIGAISGGSCLSIDFRSLHTLF